MSNPTRVLFVASEATPFTPSSTVAQIVRTLPEKLQDSGSYELRIMMPRYGIISERRNRLHEVIRLSGAELMVGDQKEVLKVKVASIPGIRLQVYFMENNRYFKRKGAFTDKQGAVFEDNAERALFFGRAALRTIHNLGWSPDLVHAFGWASAFAPYLIKTEYADDELLGGSKVVYTPDGMDAQTSFAAALLSTLGHDGTELEPRTLDGVAREYADAVMLPPESEGDGPRFSSLDSVLEDATAVYDDVLGEVPA